jgi:hypothetical protein
MTELNDLLDRASELDHPPTPVSDDLARARAALRHRRGRTIRIGSLAAVAVIAVGVVGSSAIERDRDAATVQERGPDGVQLVAADADAGPYTFGKLPEGWVVQGVTPAAVTIAPPDAEDQNSNSFLGKLVIMYDEHPPSGDVTSFNGRDFFTRGDTDHTTINVRTGAGQPPGTVYVQYPDSAGWDEATMIEFLDAVRVNESAEPGVG